MNINIEDYVTHDQIKEAVIELIKESVKNHLKDEKNFERIISNAAYAAASKISDDEFNADLKNKLKENLNKVVSSLSYSTVFKSPNAWDREQNTAYGFLQSCFDEMKPCIKEKFTEAVNNEVDEQSVRFVKNELYGAFTEWAEAKFLNC